jgi:hypothetical protein
MAMRRRNLISNNDGIPGFNYRAIVSVDHKIMYMALNKNACTSLKWMMAELCGEDTSTFTPLLQPYVSMADSIHNRRLWKVTPRLLQLDGEIRSSISPEYGWFVFTVVRDPRLRLFSAWQNKILLDNPEYVAYRAEPWYPRRPATREQIHHDFSLFVEMLEGRPDHPLLTDDGHFRSQVEMLMLDTFDYSRIFDISELQTMVNDLVAHLQERGASDVVRLQRHNDTPLRSVGSLFDDGVGERIERIYSRDFDVFGNRWRLSDIASEPVWSDRQLEEVQLRASFGRRLTDLLSRAKRLRKQLDRTSDENARLRSRLAELETPTIS